MASSRTEKIGERGGVLGLVDSLRYHELSRQGLGLILLWVCAWFTEPAGEGRMVAGFAIAAVGQLWRIYAAGVIYKNRRLASTGAYSLVRHPLYLGNFLILGGFTLACGNLWMVAVVAAFFLFYYPAAIRYEDHKLEGIFGDEWREWSAGRPAMLPWKFRWKAHEDASWNMHQSMMRNGELYYTVFEVAAAVLLWCRAIG